MRLVPSDPDIETLVARIRRGDLDLQPDFQRGEIWPRPKQQRLIDSILRDWHIPPIHVILEDEGARVSVLDGQQRLAAIRDFVTNKFPIDGYIEPISKDLKRLNGAYFVDLPADIQRGILSFPIRMFTIVDYIPSEPGELFYRLNQPTTLTAAEQRNAFFGKARAQVKELVAHASQASPWPQIFGFPDTRLSYDDVIARSLYFLELGSLRHKLTSATLADKYRGGKAFDPALVDVMHRAVEVVATAQKKRKGRVKLSKGGAQSWLVFLASILRRAGKLVREEDLASFLVAFEEMREAVVIDREIPASMFSKRLDEDVQWRVLASYEVRSASRVSDISSVVVRDLAIWIFFLAAFHPIRNLIVDQFPRDKKALMRLSRKNMAEFPNVEAIAEHLKWGDEF